MMRKAWIICLGLLAGPALADQTPTPAQAVTPLTQAEMKSFRNQVARCWNLGTFSNQAQTTVVTVTFDMDRTGKPKPDSMRLIGAGKDTRPAVREVYGSAKRAVLRCGAKGYKLPLEKYDEWKNIEITFDPERTLLK